jgi:hypothetical protein
MNTSPFLSVNQPCDETLQWAKKRLSQAHLRAIQTFDLQTARSGLHDCSCPNHGTNECDCQMVILLVYGKSAEPIALILHGNDGQTWLSIVDDTSQKNNAVTAATIRHSLKGNPIIVE